MRRLTDYYPGKPISAKELNWLIEQVERLTNLSAAPPLELNGNQIRLVPGELWATITEPCDDGAHGWAEVQSNGDGTFSIVDGGRNGSTDLNPAYEVNGNCADVDTIVRLYVGNFGEFLFQYCCATGSGSGGGLAQWYCLEEPSSGSGESGSGSGSGCDCVPYLCLEWAYIDGDGVLNFTGNGTPVTLTQEGCDGYFFENEYTGISFDGQTLVINAFDFGPGDGEYQGGSGWDCNSAYTVSPVYADPGFPATFILVPGVCGSGSGGAWYCLEEPSSGSGESGSGSCCVGITQWCVDFGDFSCGLYSGQIVLTGTSPVWCNVSGGLDICLTCASLTGGITLNTNTGMSYQADALNCDGPNTLTLVDPGFGCDDWPETLTIYPNECPSSGSGSGSGASWYCLEEPSSGSGSGSGSGFVPNDCGSCDGGLPEKWCVTLSGFTNDTSCQLTALNGSWTFTYQGGCAWQAVDFAPSESCEGLPSTLYFGYWGALPIWTIVWGSLGDGVIIYSVSDDGFVCDGPNTLANQYPFGSGSGYGTGTAVISPC